LPFSALAAGASARTKFSVEVYDAEALFWREHEAGGEVFMLRITIHDEAAVMRFVVEGKLVGLWVKELENCWEGALAAEPARTMLVNLAAVTFVDAAGRELLTRMRQRGTRLLSTGVSLISAILAEIESEAKPKTAEGSNFKQD
jgi:anti-anti-sigma regulatory factor